MTPIELYFKPGMNVNVRLLPDPFSFSQPVKYTLTVRGWKPGQYIILDHPSAGPNLASIPQDPRCAIRYVSEGNVISFSSKGLAVFKSLGIFIIQYPKALDSQIALRSQKRIKSTMLATIKLVDAGAGWDYPFDGMIMNIDHNGLLLSSSESIPPNAVIALDFEFVTGEKVVQIQAKVRSKRKNLRSIEYPYMHGCEFIKLKPEEKTVFQNFFDYIFNHLDETEEKEKTEGRPLELEMGQPLELEP